MSRAKRFTAVIIALALTSLFFSSAAQRRRPQQRPAPSRRTATAPTDSQLTGIYRLDDERSIDPRLVAERAAASLPAYERQRVVDSLAERLASPYQLAIERRGNLVSIASTRAPRINFEADGREHTERAADGHTVTTKATIYDDNLVVTSSGSPDDEFSVTFDPIENGKRLRVTRRIYSQELQRPIVVQSLYDKLASVARWNIYGEQPPPQVVANNNQPAPRVNRNRTPTAPPVIRPRPEPPPTETSAPVYTNVFQIGAGTRFVTVLNQPLSTVSAREGDSFTLTVREPQGFDGAVITGHITRLERGGRISGRSGMTLAFDRITLRDGRSADFAGAIESLHTPNGEDVTLDAESGSNVEGSDNQTNRTIERTAIGAAVGALIGAIAGGGKGAAIGAAIGAGAGAGSVYAQGRDNLDLPGGTEMVIRATRRS